MQLLFTSQGHIGLMDADGGNLRYLEFAVPDQETWQPCGALSDGRLLLLSMEARRDGPGRPFSEYYHKTSTRIWAYDIGTEALFEVVTAQRQAPFQTPQLLLSDDRLLVQVVRDEGGQIYNVDIGGSDWQPVTEIGEGLPYGFSLSPDGSRLAYHLASPAGYQIWTSDPFGKERVLVAAHAEYLYFGPQWSPDGEWLAFQACRYQEDPGHDWADLCISRPDGRQRRFLTQGQALWFAATYGPAQRHGGGSNIPLWTSDGALLAACRTPEAHVPWAYQAERPDLDHFNRDFSPAEARGGTQIHRIGLDGESHPLTPAREGIWDLRPTPAPDGRTLAFCRAATGASPALWTAALGGGDAHLLTVGRQETGADHPRWLP